jgi:hypothetical protein
MSAPTLPTQCGWKRCTRPPVTGQLRCAEHGLVIERRKTPSERRKQIAPRTMRPQVRVITEAVSKAYGWIPIEEIRGSAREHSVVRIRMVAMYATRESTAMSYPEIAMEFGGKDHTTAISAIRSIRKLIAKPDAQTIFAVQAGIDAGQAWVRKVLGEMGDLGKAAE